MRHRPFQSRWGNSTLKLHTPHLCISADDCPGVMLLAPGNPLSNSDGRRNGTGHVGIAGRSLVGVSSGSTIVGVTMTISSVTEWFRFLERNSCPRMGISPIPGILL